MKSYIYAAITIILWSFMPALVKSLLQDMPSFQALCISSLFAVLFLISMLYFKGQLKQIKYMPIDELFKMAWLGFLGLFMYSAFYYYGLSQLSSQEACILNYLWPIMIVIFAYPILHEKLTKRKLIAIGLSFAGIIVISAGNFDTSNNISDKDTTLGIICCILAAACYGLFCVLNKKNKLNQEISMMIIWAVTTICSFIAGILVEDWILINWNHLFGLLCLGVGLNAIGYLMWAIALNGAKNTASIANLAYLTPVLAIFVSTILFNEPLVSTVIPALILIISGIVIQNLGNCHKEINSSR